MINFNKHLAKEIFEIQTKSGNETDMKIYLSQFANDMGIDSEFDEKGNLYMTKGDASVKPCIASHMDTVHADAKGREVFLCGDSLIALDEDMGRVGVGGDDRCGIYIAMELLRVLDNVKAVFFVEEETGCKGSLEADLDFFKDTAFVIQCDRKGYGTMVTKASNKRFKDIDLVSKEFTEDIGSIIDLYDVQAGDGGSTDVVMLKERGVEVSVVNLECGYYYPHNNKEYVNIIDLEDTLNLVFDVCYNMGSKQYKHKWEKPKEVAKVPSKVGYQQNWMTQRKGYTTTKYIPRLEAEEMAKRIFEKEMYADFNESFNSPEGNYHQDSFCPDCGGSIDSQEIHVNGVTASCSHCLSEVNVFPFVD